MHSQFPTKTVRTQREQTKRTPEIIEPVTAKRNTTTETSNTSTKLNTHAIIARQLLRDTPAKQEPNKHIRVSAIITPVSSLMADPRTAAVMHFLSFQLRGILKLDHQ